MDIFSILVSSSKMPETLVLLEITPNAHCAAVPDGVYDIVDNSINFLSGPDISRQSLNKLKEILEDVRNKRVDISSVSGLIKEETPELKALADILPKTRSELYSFLTLLFAVLQFFHPTSNDKKEVNEIINNFTINQNIINSPPSVIQKDIDGKISNPKIGRNKPCPCGSGKKFKYCHGK